MRVNISDQSEAALTPFITPLVYVKGENWNKKVQDSGHAPNLQPSDRRLKKNIELVGSSSSGINIYEWEYKDVNFLNSLSGSYIYTTGRPGGDSWAKLPVLSGSDMVFEEGKYRGVMADDIPINAVVDLDNGYSAVDYSKIDVDFEKVEG
jgi:hypothetical protein